MIGEHYLDICLTACCSIDSSNKYYKDILNNIHGTIKKYKKENPKESQEIEFVDKLELVYHLSGLRIKKPDWTVEQLYSLLESGKFGKFIPQLQTRKVDLTDEYIEVIFKTIEHKNKLLDLLTGKKELISLLNEIDLGNYSDEESIISSWEDAVEKLHTVILSTKKMDLIDEVSTLNLSTDSLDNIMMKIRKNVNSVNTIKSGFNYLTSNFTAKGYERGRYYLVGGCSGVGKSTFLVNEICSALRGEARDITEKRVYLYITAENLIDETWCRFYCCLTGKPYEVLINEINEKFNVLDLDLLPDSPEYNERVKTLTKDYKDTVEEILKERNANLIFKYVQPGKTTIRDIEIIIEETKNTHKNNLEAIYIDYLDLFSSGLNLDLRLELGVISRAFKLFAVTYNIVVLSATQLNREGYDAKMAPKLTQMGESMKKVDEADVVIFLQNTELAEEEITTENGKELYVKIRMTLLKNRSGSKENSIMAKYSKKINGESVFNYRIEEMIGIENDSDELVIDSICNFSSE